MQKFLMVSSAFFLTGAIVTPAHAQVEAVAGSVTTSVLINEISDQLNGLIDNARRSGDFLAMRAAQESLLVIDAFEASNQRSLNLAFDRIGKERQAVLNAVRETAYNIEQGRIDTLQKLQETGDQLDKLVRDTTFQRKPRIYRYRGTIVNPQETADVRVSVSGYRINQKSPYLVLDGKRYDARIEGENLRFILPRSAFEAESDQLKSQFAALNLQEKTGGVLGIGATWQ